MSAIKALEQWCKTQCDEYQNVAITNMTTSFRSGLAFCALIHRHRPDLIDYESLSKEDVFENNHLAFRVAEEKLGIPALLDAEDMVALRVPDRLSILTYVSQYYNFFNGRCPIGAVKRPAEGARGSWGCMEGPSEKKNLPVAKTFVSKTAIENRSPPSLIEMSPRTARAAGQNQKAVLVENSNKTGTLSNKCVSCLSHVHLVQRHFVEGRLFHRSCFKCADCSSVLLPGGYRPGKEPDSFVCDGHQKGQNGCSAQPIKNLSAGSVPTPKTPGPTRPAPQPPSVLLTPLPAGRKPSDPVPALPPPPWSASAQRTQAARQRFFQTAEAPPPGATDLSGRLKAPAGPEEKSRARAVICRKLAEENCNNNNTRCFVLRSAETRFGEEPNTRLGVRPTRTSPDPPGHQGVQTSTTQTSRKDPPCLKAGNTDGSRPATVNTRAPVLSDRRSQPTPVQPAPGLRTPESENGSVSTKRHKPELSSRPEVSSRPDVSSRSSSEVSSRSSSEVSSRSSSEDSSRTTRSPPAWTPVSSPVSSPQSDPSAWFTDLSPQKPSPSSRNLDPRPGSSSTPVRSPSSQPAPQSPCSPATPPAPPPRGPSTRSPAGSKTGKCLSAVAACGSETRSAPQMTSRHLPMEQIEKELDDIETNLSLLEKEGVEMERNLRSCETEGDGDVLMDPLMVDWFNLIRKKQMMIRRESELVYIAKTLDLEEQQPGVEGQLRSLLEKPDHLKSIEEHQQQTRLMDRLVEIVNGRNAIVDGLDEDRLREVEEDLQLNEMMQSLGVKKPTAKRKSSISLKLFRRRSKKNSCVAERSDY